MRKHLIRSVAVVGMTTAMLGVGATPSVAIPEVTVKIDDKGAVSTVSGHVVITGTVSCPVAALDLVVYVRVEQTKDGNRNGGGGEKVIDCDASGPTPWTIPSEYEDGFSKGLASATVTVHTSAYYYPQLAEETADVILQECSVIGTRGVDTLTGSWRNDVICGLRGADELVGDSGRDRIVGGDGSDSIYGQRGDDTLLGGPGSDWIVGGPGKDDCQANDGSGIEWSCE